MAGIGGGNAVPLSKISEKTQENAFILISETDICIAVRYTEYSGIRVIASHILLEICLLIGELSIRGTKLTLNARLGTKSNLLIEQYCY